MRTPILLLGLLTTANSAFAAEQVKVWAVPSVAKVRPDDPAQVKNLVWEEQARTVTIAGAKNEHLPFQLVISVPPPPPPPAKQPAAAGFFVSVGDLVSSSGRIPSDDVKLYFEHEILCPAPSSSIGASGFWPDALAPLTTPFSMAAAYRRAVRNRVIWIDVVTPADAQAGEYSGIIRVTKDKQQIAQMRLRVRIYNFALPAESHLVAFMGLFPERIAEFHHVPASSTKAKALLREYNTFLYTHRMEPWFNDELKPGISKSGESVKLSFDRGSIPTVSGTVENAASHSGHCPAGVDTGHEFSIIGKRNRDDTVLSRASGGVLPHAWMAGPVDIQQPDR